MGALKPISSKDKRMSDFFITLDKSDRICLNASLREELELTGNDLLYLFYDERERRIGVSKHCDDTSVEPFKFDKKGYTGAKGFLSWCEYDKPDGSIRLIFDGMEGDVYVFREPGRKNVSLRQDRNGNLDRY